jgi:hypothetical protein
VSDLDDLDREQREWRREQLSRWTRTRELDLRRARIVAYAPDSTPEQRHEARILMGAYYGLTIPGGFAFGPSQTPLDHPNRHSHTPDPPGHQRSMLARLRAALRRSDGAHATVSGPAEWPATASIGFELPAPPDDPPRWIPAATDPVVRDPDAAPDLVEEILGWKVLVFGDDGFLQRNFDHAPLIGIPRELSSPRRIAQWPASGWLLATCPRDPEHEPPVEGCSCGIYAVAEVGTARPYLWDAPLTVLARVGLAGKVIPGSRGWRAERARVVALTRTGAGTRDYPGILARVADNYAVPILDLDLLESRPAASPASEV